MQKARTLYPDQCSRERRCWWESKHVMEGEPSRLSPKGAAPRPREGISLGSCGRRRLASVLRSLYGPDGNAPTAARAMEASSGTVLDYLGGTGSRQWDGKEACPKPSPQTGLDCHCSLRGLLPTIPSRFFRFFQFCLTSRPILSNNYFVLPDGFGGVSVWRKFGCKRVNPLRTRCVALSARYSRKTLSRRSSATPFT
jgi:hypothetical protein